MDDAPRFPYAPGQPRTALPDDELKQILAALVDATKVIVGRLNHVRQQTQGIPDTERVQP